MKKKYDSVDSRYPWLKHWSEKSILDAYSQEKENAWEKIKTPHRLNMDDYKAMFEGRSIRNAIEIGCADGFMLASLSTLFPEIFPVYMDISFEMLESARQRQSEAVLLRSDAHQMPFKDHAFDCVLCEDLLCSVIDYRGVFEELCRLTKNVLIVSMKLRLKGKTINDPAISYQEVVKGIRVPYVVINVRDLMQLAKTFLPKGRMITMMASPKILHPEITKIPDIKRVLNVLVALDRNDDGSQGPPDIETRMKEFIKKCEDKGITT